MDITRRFDSNGEDIGPETTAIISPTPFEGGGKRFGPEPVHDDDYIVEPRKDQSRARLLTAYEVQAEIRLTYKGTLTWIRKHITPIGGTTRIGNRILVHQWALNEVLRKLMWKGPRKKPSPPSANLSRYVEGLTKRKNSQPKSKPKG